MRRLLPVAAGLLAAGSLFGLAVLVDDDDAGGTVAAGIDGRSVFARMLASRR